MTQKTDSLGRTNRIASLVLLCVGVFLLLYVYATHSSFWKDEVFLALNFLEQDGPRIALPLGHNQAAPIGFLQVNRWLEGTLGHSEKTFWLVSLLSGIGLLIGTAQFFKKHFPRFTDTIALGLLAFNAATITYGVQFKPYMLDALVSFGLMAMFWSMPKHDLKLRHYAGWIGLGLVSLWLSFTSVFVIAGLGAWLIGEAWVHKRPRIAWGWAAANAVLAAFFVALWIGIYRDLDSSNIFHNWWANQGGFMPKDETAVLWLGATLKGTLSFIFGNVPGYLLLLLVIVGAPYAWKLNKRSAALGLPIALTIIAAAAQTYPAQSRLILFWLPLVLPFVALGIYRLLEIIGKQHRNVGIAIAALLAIAFSANSYKKVTSGNPQDIRAVAQTVVKQAQAGDVVWIHPRALDLYTYYLYRYPPVKGVTVTSTKKGNTWGIYKSIKEKYANKRVFILSTESEFFVNEIDLLKISSTSEKTLQDQIQRPVAEALILDFSKPETEQEEAR